MSSWICSRRRPTRIRRFLKWFGVPTGWEDARHGSAGWLHTTVADFSLLFNDKRLLKVVLNGALGALRAGVTTLYDLLHWGWFTDKSFPKLDKIVSATISVPAPAPAPKKTPGH